jgi:hypothetical protein
MLGVIRRAFTRKSQNPPAWQHRVINHLITCDTIFNIVYPLALDSKKRTTFEVLKDGEQSHGFSHHSG